MTIVSEHPEGLIDRSFRFCPVRDENRRISIYEEPIHEHVYVIGTDHAYDIAGRDFDAGVVLDEDTSPVRQVGELHGHWGPHFAKVLDAAARNWHDPFHVEERQVALRDALLS